MFLSVLVVSRTASLLNQMVKSINNATKLKPENLEILCSWNGSESEIKEIYKDSHYKINIAQKEKYNFASNVNKLALKSKGELILIINDDVILDSNSIDSAIECLQTIKNAGLIGSRLRDKKNRITHAGILFNILNSPYHRLEGLVNADHIILNQNPQKITAVTGALMLIPRNILNKVKLNEKYNVCGEDVELCLDIKQKLNKDIIYCPCFSGIHEAESTRRKIKEQLKNKRDKKRLIKRYQSFLRNISLESLYFEYSLNKKSIHWMIKYNIYGLLKKPHNNSIILIYATNIILYLYILRKKIKNYLSSNHS